MVNDYLLHEAQHLVFRDQSGPSMIQKRSVPRSLRPSSKGLSGSTDLESRREKALRKYLSEGKDKEKKKPKKDKKDRSDRSSTKSTKSSSSISVGSDMSDFNPVAGSPVSYLLQELRKIVPEGTAPKTCQALKMVGVFSEWTSAQKAAYDKDAIAAIRGRNIDLMRTWVASGRTMQAANSFGESLLHMACRRGFLDVVQFLIDECGHDIWIRDDTGRTPLHDACWTAEPCPELVDYILAKECDMLLVSDKRGHTPLDYARKDHWEFWIQHLKGKDLTTLLPKRESFYTTAESSVPICHNLVIVENLDMFMKEMKFEDKAEVKSRRRKSTHNAILEEDGGR
jgi:hypothetical protein